MKSKQAYSTGTIGRQEIHKITPFAMRHGRLQKAKKKIRFFSSHQIREQVKKTETLADRRTSQKPHFSDRRHEKRKTKNSFI